MDFNTWIQLNVKEQIEYLQNTPENEILIFITELCSIMIKKSSTIIEYIEECRDLRHKIKSKPDIDHIEKHAMERMCELCKSENKS